MLSVLCFALCTLTHTARGAVHWVPWDYTTIQAAVDAAVDSDTVLIADGTYTGDGNRDIYFNGKAITVSSVNGPEFCIIDCQGADAEPHRGFKFNHNESRESILAGISITNGYKTLGGAVYCATDTSVSIRNCIISANYAEQNGGGIYLLGSSAEIVNCTFIGNTAAVSGGAIFCDPASQPTIGGAPGNENYFSGNFSFAGADISALDSQTVVNLNYNIFAGYCYSDYYVSSQDNVDLSGSIWETDPIEQDVYITVDGDDSRDGLSWETAFKTIQHALSLTYGTESDPVTIHIGPGVFSPSATGEILPLPLISRVNLAGESEFSTIIDGEYTSTIFWGKNDGVLVIQDLTITGGFSQKDGGGVRCASTNPHFLRCTFSGNQANDGGGGMFIEDASSPQLENCTFWENIADTGGAGLLCNASTPVIQSCTFKLNSCDYGAGITCKNNSNARISNCLFTENYEYTGLYCGDSSPIITDSEFSYNRIGIYCRWQSSPVISGCLFQGNPGTVTTGGGLQCFGQCSPEVIDCIFIENTAFSGGAIRFSGWSNPTVTGCLIENNTASDSGGGIHISENSHPVFDACEIINNTAPEGGAVMCNSDATFTRCIFRGNRAEMGGGIFCESDQSVIGGSEGDGNLFMDNQAFAGADIFGLDLESPVNARFNHFYGCPLSDYYVTSSDNFDLDGWTSEYEPVLQDVFVSPTGSDNNDGLTSETAFRTIHCAMRRVCGVPDKPVTIFLSAGEYSPSSNGESFPLPLVQWVNIRGESADITILDAQQTDNVVRGYFDDYLTIDNCTISGGLSKTGGGIYLWKSSPEISNCVFTENEAAGYECAGGAIDCWDSSPEIINCLFSNNRSLKCRGAISVRYGSSPRINDCSISDNIGNGIAIENSDSEPEISNCSISGNSESGIFCGYYTVSKISDCLVQNNGYAGVYFEQAQGIIAGTVISDNLWGIWATGSSCSFEYINCLVINNEASGMHIYCADCALKNVTISGNGGFGVSNSSGGLILENSIVWNNNPDSEYEIWLGSTSPVNPTGFRASYFDIQGGMDAVVFDQYCYLEWGPGIMNADPFFTDSEQGEYFLSQIRSGEDVQSPCVDAGSDLSSNICFPAGDDEMCLSGFSTRSDAVPDAGIVDLGWHGPSPLNLNIWMPSHLFRTGDSCSCKIILENTGEQEYRHRPLFVILDVYGSYYFWPSFQALDYLILDSIPIGLSEIIVLPSFDWPDNVGTAQEINWYAALTDPDFIDLMTGIATWTFGWE